jgi:hypothetical protein
MAAGDPITGARSTAIMRRINALEAQPRPLTVGYSSAYDRATNMLAVDSNDHIFLGGTDTSSYPDAEVQYGHVFRTSDLQPVSLSTEYPGSETRWPPNHSLAGSNIYWPDSTTSYKYSIFFDSWAELTSSDSEFDSADMIKTDGTDLYIQTGIHQIKRFNTSGVEQATINFDIPATVYNETDDTWAMHSFDFDSSGNILLVANIYSLEFNNTRVHVLKYDDTGTEDGYGGSPYYIASLGDVVTDQIEGVLEIIVNTGGSNTDYFVVITMLERTASEWHSTSYSNTGTNLGEIYSSRIINGAAYYEDEIYTYEAGYIAAFNNAGTIQREARIFIHTEPDQTTFYRYPLRGTESGKVSLGTPDGGGSVPTVFALTGRRPSAFEPSTMRTAIQGEAAVRFKEYDSGTTTSTTADKLVDSGQNFSSTVELGDVVKNTTDDTQATVSSILSNTTLSLSADIMESGETYRIVGAYTTSETPLARNIFDIALTSQTDWTTPTITVGDQILDEVYTEMETVLTELETASVE